MVLMMRLNTPGDEADLIVRIPLLVVSVCVPSSEGGEVMVMVAECLERFQWYGGKEICGGGGGGAHVSGDIWEEQFWQDFCYNVALY